MEGTAWGTVFALAYFALFQLCGMALVRRALPGESGGAKLLMGSVLGSVCLQWFPVLFAFFLDFSLPAHLCAGGAALVLTVGVSLLGGGKGSFGGKSILFAFVRQKALWGVLLLWFFFCVLVWRSFSFQDGRIYSSQATYGDMSMHLSFITSLARQGDFPPDYSLLPGTRLSYPFLGDSISASLYLFGAPLRLSYAFPMWAAGAQAMFGFFLFAFRLLGSGKKAGAAFALFFGNGGLGFLYFLGGGKENFTRIFTAFYETPTNLIGENIRWVNVVADMMLPQRATLFGWAVLFPVLALLYRGVFQGERRCFPLAGVLAGALPMIHTHSFLALALVCGAWLVFSLLSAQRMGTRVCKALILGGLPLMCVLQTVLRQKELGDSPALLWFALGVLGLCALLALFLVGKEILAGKGKKLLSTWGAFAGLVCILALPQLFTWTFRQAAGGSFVRGHFAWVVGEDNYLVFYLKNMGLTALLGLFGLLLAKEGEFPKFAPVLPIWFLAEFVEFQPNDYDNNKLLYVAFAFLCCAGAQCFFQFLGAVRSRGLRGVLAVAAAGVSLCSAVLTWGRETVARYELFGEGAIALCGWVEENLPGDAVILTDTRHNNEIAALTGRNVVCGSPAYLYYHGLPYYKSEEDVKQMYRDPKGNKALFLDHDVDAVLVSDFERTSYPVDQEALDELFPVIYDDGGRVLYKVKGESGGEK